MVRAVANNEIVRGAVMQGRTRKLLKSLGCELSHGLVDGTQRHLATQVRSPDAPLQITRDIEYGSHDRQRLDVFAQEPLEDAPVLVYAHGGGFIMGDKRLPKLPFYDNIGLWAASRGWIGVTINYRLAPDHMWPSGTVDLALAIGWLRDNVAAYGGSPKRIFLMGQAAGATHIAGYLAMPEMHQNEGSCTAGAVLVSGTYDPSISSPNAYHLAYYGIERDDYRRFSAVPGLVATNVPLCFAVSEFDGIDYRRQAAQLVGAFGKARGDIPRIHWLAGHNHLSSVMAIGTPVDTLGPLVEDFISSVIND